MTDEDQNSASAVSSQSRSPLSVIAIGLSLIAILGSVYLLSMIQSTLNSQADLVDANQSLIQQLNVIKELQAADQLTRPAAAKNSTTPTATVRLAEQKVVGIEQRLDSELELLSAKLVSDFPQDAEALHVAALIDSQTRRYAAAQKLWEECIRLQPTIEMYYLNVASVAIEQGNDQLAVDVLQRATAQGMNSVGIYHHLGLALSHLGKFEEAAAAIEKSIALDPQSAAAWLMIGQLKLDLDKPAEAELAFQKAKELGAESASFYVGMGNALARQGKREQAREYLQVFSERKDADKLTGTERYEVLSTREIQRTAFASFQEAAIFYSRRKNLLEAERLLLLCNAIEPEQHETLGALADLYFQNQLLNNERVVRERIVRAGKASFLDYINLAKVLATLGDQPGAEGVLKAAATAFPNRVEPYAVLSQFHLDDNRLAAARWYAQQAIERQPSAEGFRFLANICDKMNDSTGAQQARQIASQLEEKP